MAASIAILLCTFNGERFLRAQLDSLYRQTHTNWQLWVSDDGSTDATLAILHETQQQWGEGRLHIVQGPRSGATANFLSLVRHSDIHSDHYAYCDQDDIWEPERLARGLRALQQQGGQPDQPALYGTRTRYIDETGKITGQAGRFSRKPGFGNALVQCIAGGNTMLFNTALRDVLCQAPAEVAPVNHDWWTYLLATGTGGRVIYDPEPTVRYRQHSINLIGKNRGLGARLERLDRLLNRSFQQANEANIAALQAVKSQLTTQSQLQLQAFADATGKGSNRRRPLARLLAWRRAGLYRQQPIEDLALAFAALVGRL